MAAAISSLRCEMGSSAGNVGRGRFRARRSWRARGCTVPTLASHLPPDDPYGKVNRRQARSLERRGGAARGGLGRGWGPRWPMEELVRANWMKFVIHGLKRTDEPIRGNVLERIPDEVRREIRVAGRLAWLPARVFVTLANAILAGVGP